MCLVWKSKQDDCSIPLLFSYTNDNNNKIHQYLYTAYAWNESKELQQKKKK